MVLLMFLCAVDVLFPMNLVADDRGWRQFIGREKRGSSWRYAFVYTESVIDHCILTLSNCHRTCKKRSKYTEGLKA